MFYPYIQGLDGGDEFYCEGKNGSGLGHFIKIGCTHRLSDWSKVDTNDNMGCSAGLHLGGLTYISDWEEGNHRATDIHTCFVDPMNIGAIPIYSGSYCIRVLEYYVHGSLTAINHGIYHASEYATKTEASWKTISEEIIKEYGELAEADAEEVNQISNL